MLVGSQSYSKKRVNTQLIFSNKKYKTAKVSNFTKAVSF